MQLLFYRIVIFLYTLNLKQTETKNKLKANALVSSGTKFYKPENKLTKYVRV